MNAFVHRMARRLIGRDDLSVQRPPPPTTPEIQLAKTNRDLRLTHDAHNAIDSFTAAMERAMRGEQRGRHGQARG